MSKPNEEMSNDLLRQRRNLLVISLLICFVDYAQVELGKLSIFGIEYSQFGRPHAVIYALWVGFFYFLIRYGQYFYQEGRQKLASSFVSTLDEKAASRIKELVLEEHPSDFREDCSFHVLQRWKWIYHGQEKVGTDEMGHDKINNFEMYISPLKLWREVVASIFSVTFAKSAVTDYLLPFVVALFTVVYAGSEAWQKLS